VQLSCKFLNSVNQDADNLLVASTIFYFLVFLFLRELIYWIAERRNIMVRVRSVIKDIEYKNINGKSLQLDIYKPRNITQPAPLLVFIHGGAWVGGKRSDYLVYLLDFAKKGYITATISYRLVKDTRSSYSESNVDAVLDGSLDSFIEAYLLAAAGGDLKKGVVAEDVDD